jgi:hypothetical protein
MVLLSEFGGSCEERGGRLDHAAVVDDSLDRGEQRGHGLGRAPRANGDVGDLVADEVQGSEREARIDKERVCRPVVVVLGVERGEYDARVEQQRRHWPGRVALTCSAALPPWGRGRRAGSSVARPRCRLNGTCVVAG